MKNLRTLSFLLCFGTCAIIFLGGCGSKDNSSVKFITNTVTNFITRYVTNTDIINFTNEVPVPAAIPQTYIDGDTFLKWVRNVPILTSDDQALFAMDDVKVLYILDNTIKQTILEDDVKAKFELTLRKNGVPINPDSRNTVFVGLTGFYDETGMLLCYNYNVSVSESQLIFRNGEGRRGMVTVWQRGGSHGTVGKVKANEALLRVVEKSAEVFANDYLSANPKQNTIKRNLTFANSELQFWQTQLANVNAGKNWTPLLGWDVYGFPMIGNLTPPSSDAADAIRQSISAVTNSIDKLQKQLQ
jgi:hypothetical protein